MRCQAESGGRRPGAPAANCWVHRLNLNASLPPAGNFPAGAGGERFSIKDNLPLTATECHCA
jgi:hypothetical protein